MLFRSRADIRILHTIEYIAGFGGGGGKGPWPPNLAPNKFHERSSGASGARKPFYALPAFRLDPAGELKHSPD